MTFKEVNRFFVTFWLLFIISLFVLPRFGIIISDDIVWVIVGFWLFLYGSFIFSIINKLKEEASITPPFGPILGKFWFILWSGNLPNYIILGILISGLIIVIAVLLNFL